MNHFNRLPSAHVKFNSIEVYLRKADPWEITLVDLGDTTTAGDRLRYMRDYVGDGSKYCTYGDGAWINGEFFVLERDVIDWIEADARLWEQ
jgi:hypothetical protein